MKKLTDFSSDSKETKENADEGHGTLKKNTVHYLPAMQDRETAIEAKLKQLRGNFLGRPIVKFDVAGMRDVWIPYCYLVYNYNTQTPGGKAPRLPKTGEIGIVYDINETHPFQYDIYESGHLSLKKGNIVDDGSVIIDVNLSDKEIRAQTEDYIKYKIMLRSFGTPGTLKQIKHTRFYRPAVEIEVIYKGKNSNMRYAWLDSYGIQNEHVSGIKYRLNHKG